MKPSRFNMILSSEDLGDTVVIYNTYSSSIFITNFKIANLLKQDQFDEALLSRNIKLELKNHWILIDQDLDELALVREHQQRIKFRSNKAAFMVLTTYGCNLTCPYCYESTKKGKLSEPLLSDVIKFIKRRITHHRSKEVDLEIFGGEPFLCPEVSGKIISNVEKWSRLQGIECRTILYTNGTIFNNKVHDYLVGHSYRYTQVSIDGYKEDHDRTRRYHNGLGSYNIIMDNILKMFDANMKPVIRINVDNNNIAGIEKLLDDLVDRGMNSQIPIGFGIIRPMTQASESYEYSLDDQVLTNTLPKLWEKALARDFQISLKPKRAFVYCSSFLDSAYIIDTLGDVYKCSGLVGLPEHRIGMIKKDGKFKNIGDVFDQWMQRDPINHKDCRECMCLPICGGGCGATCTTMYDNYHAVDCFDRSRQIVAKRVALYLKSTYPDLFTNVEPENIEILNSEDEKNIQDSISLSKWKSESRLRSKSCGRSC